LLAKGMTGIYVFFYHEDMIEDIPGRMPEDIPITKYINIMVGITRNKIMNYII